MTTQQPPSPPYIYPPPPKRPNWFARHKWLTGIGAALLAIVAISTGAGSGETGSDNGRDAASVTQPVDRPEPKTSPEPKPTAEPEPIETVSQQNARESAQDYIDYSAFSRTGLIGQLKFEGFSTKDATYGVDSVDVSWKEQAALSAQSYLDYTSFSRDGLIEQLRFEGFTQKQAEYGVRSTGL